MLSGHSFRPDSNRIAGARQSVAGSRTALAAFLTEVEQLRTSLASGIQTLERPEAVNAADEAASFLSLAADALRDGSASLAALEDGDLIDELTNLAMDARAC